MKQTQTIPKTFVGVGYTRDRAGLFNDKRDDIAAEIAKLTSGRDLVFDATYSEQGFVETAKTVRRGGNWIVLGVGPGKTTRLVGTHSPVDAILGERGATHVNVNLLRYFSEPATLDSEAQAFLQRGWLWRWSGRRRDSWSRTSVRPSTTPLRRSMRDCNRSRRAVAYWAKWR
jgi:hypothetical protein